MSKCCSGSNFGMISAPVGSPWTLPNPITLRRRVFVLCIPKGFESTQSLHPTPQKSLASRVGVTGSVMGVDISKPMLDVAVWDTVGSYGIPAGLGFAPLARYFALFVLGFHDTSFGDHVEVGLACGRGGRAGRVRSYVLDDSRGQKPKGHVEQTWFAGAHCNVGGGYPDAGLSAGGRR